MEKYRVKVGNGNTKLGSQIPNINLPAGCTCREDAPCAKLCYAMRGNFRYKAVMNRAMENLLAWKSDPVQFEKDIAYQTSLSKYVRWHSSGDIPDMEYLKMMCRVAMEVKETNYLCFTKKYELVNQFLADGNTIPDNLTIVLSAWGDWIPNNPYNLPMAWVKLKKEDTDIPENARECPSFCGNCAATSNSCWKLKCGESVYFKQH